MTSFVYLIITAGSSCNWVWWFISIPHMSNLSALWLANIKLSTSCRWLKMLGTASLGCLSMLHVCMVHAPYPYVLQTRIVATIVNWTGFRWQDFVVPSANLTVYKIPVLSGSDNLSASCTLRSFMNGELLVLNLAPTSAGCTGVHTLFYSHVGMFLGFAIFRSGKISSIKKKSVNMFFWL